MDIQFWFCLLSTVAQLLTCLGVLMAAHWIYIEIKSINVEIMNINFSLNRVRKLLYEEEKSKQ